MTPRRQAVLDGSSRPDRDPHRSMQEVARQAMREYVENHSRADLLDQVLDEEPPRYSEALEARSVICLTLGELVHVAERTLEGKAR